MLRQLVQDITRWVIFVEGGGWCFSLEDCAGRAKGGGGSSVGVQNASRSFGGILSPNATENREFLQLSPVAAVYPFTESIKYAARFFNYSLVFIHYCGAVSLMSCSRSSWLLLPAIPRPLAQMAHRTPPTLCSQRWSAAKRSGSVGAPTWQLISRSSTL